MVMAALTPALNVMLFFTHLAKHACIEALALLHSPCEARCDLIDLRAAITAIDLLVTMHT